ncbi:hypothetical protein [Methylobacterium sp. Leaf93]|uniref:hypothetical protein n=1 Tax=Methylobacterium sp. Leaf93 TaxID=1736249 RepID=UPI0012E86CD1|nr:hypothetical protein [Methylobacterium sp. Leaf93]
MTSDPSAVATDGLSVPWITMQRDPDPISPELSSALAEVVIEWGKFERGLQMDLTVLRRYPHIKELTPEEPRSFNKVIELWRKSIRALYPTVVLYNNIASELCSKGKIMSQHRNRVIHGIWLRCDPEDTYEYHVLATTGIDTVKSADSFYVDPEYLKAISTDIKTISDKLYEFAVNRMLHAQQGLLKEVASPAP